MSLKHSSNNQKSEELPHLSMYASGSLNSSTVGVNTGASGNNCDNGTSSSSEIIALFQMSVLQDSLPTTTATTATTTTMTTTTTDSTSSTFDYEGKLFLAPMVRCGTLPLRLLSRRYGADCTYSPEIIAIKLRNCRRVVNELLGTVDFVHNKELVLRTTPLDSPLIVQIGAASADVAVAAAKVVYARLCTLCRTPPSFALTAMLLVVVVFVFGCGALSCNDVFGLDLNMGCPKNFSTHGGMGAALLKQPEVAADILSSVIRACPQLAVTCKIRLLESTEATVALMHRLAATGVRAIAVHARQKHERPVDRAHWDSLRAVVEAGASAVQRACGGGKQQRARRNRPVFDSDHCQRRHLCAGRH